MQHRPDGFNNPNTSGFQPVRCNLDPLNRLQSVAYDLSGPHENLADSPILPAATVTYEYRQKNTSTDVLLGQKIGGDMFRMKTRVLIFLCSFAIGIAVTAVWRMMNRNLVRVPSERSAAPTPSQSQSTQPGWQRIDLDGKATFSVPGYLSPAPKHPQPFSRAFTNYETLWFSLDQLTPEQAYCDFYAKDLVSRGRRIESTVVDGRKSILERKEAIPFSIEHEGPILKGIIICVPDSTYGTFFGVGRFKSEDDYQVLQKIIDSIKFTHPQP